MRDKGLDIPTFLLFIIGGTAILLLSLIHSMTIIERISSILFASTGIVWVLRDWVPERVEVI